MNTRRYPRTLQEAFGPYTSNQIEEPESMWDWQDEVVMWGCGICAACLLVLVAVGVVR